MRSSLSLSLRVLAATVSLLALTTSQVMAAGKEVKLTAKPTSYDKLPAAKKGGTLFLDLAGNPKVMNPILSSDNNSGQVEPFLWTTLFAEDMDTLQPIPYLAESVTVSADKKSYTFVLNKNAKWADGTPVTTADVKFTFDTLMDPKTDAAAQRSYWEGTKLEVKDATTFVFSIGTPKFDTLRSLYLFQTIQKKSFDGEPDFNKAKAVMNPVGNGPYVFKSFSRDQKIEFERNPNWWGNGLAAFKNRHNADKIVFRIIADPNLAYERFLKGELDVYTFQGPGLETYAKKARGTDKAKVGTSATEGKPVWATEIKNKAPRGFGYVGWNLRKPMFQSKKTRQALAQLVDIPQIIEKIYYGYAYQSTSPFGSLTLNSDPELRKPVKMLTFDLKKALAGLKEDGWADTDKDGILDKTINGQKVAFKFELKYNSNNPARGKVAQIMKENFKKAGIEISIRSVEWNAFLSDVDNRQFDAVILAWTATPYPNPKQTWHTDSEKNQGSNFIGYSNKKVDELIEKANVEFDLAKRAKVLHEINRILYDEQPYLWLTEPASLIMGVNSKVKSPGGVWAMTYDVDPPVSIYTYE